MSKISNWFKQSYLVTLWNRFLQKDFSNNKIVKFFDLVFNKFSLWINSKINMNEKAREVIDESLLFRFFKWLTNKPWIINGVILVLCLNVPHTMWNNIYIALGVFAVTFIYFLRNIFWGDGKLNFKNMGLPFILLMIGVVIASFVSVDRANSYRQLFLWLVGFLAYINVACSMKSKKDVVGFCYFLLVLVIGMSLFGLYQNYVGVEVKEAYVDINLNEGMKGRIYGSVENPNNFAEILLIMIPLLAGMFLGEKSWKNKIVILLLALMPIAAILLTGTRSGWGALGFAALLFIILWDKRIVPIFLICCALAFAALPTVSPQIYKRVMTIFMSSDHSMSYRDTIMNATMPILKENPISGIGLGSANFSRYLANNYEFELTPPHSHNVFVQVWVETGFLGFAGFVLLLASIVIYGIRAVHQINKLKKIDREKYDEKNYLKFIIIGIVSGVVGLSIMGFLDYVLFYPRVMILIFTYLGVCKSAIYVSKTSEGE